MTSMYYTVRHRMHKYNFSTRIVSHNNCFATMLWLIQWESERRHNNGCWELTLIQGWERQSSTVARALQHTRAMTCWVVTAVSHNDIPTAYLYSFTTYSFILTSHTRRPHTHHEQKLLPSDEPKVRCVAFNKIKSFCWREWHYRDNRTNY